MRSCACTYAGVLESHFMNLYSVNQTAQTLGVGRTFTYLLINEGRLETVKLGRRTLVKVSSIEKLIAESAVVQ